MPAVAAPSDVRTIDIGGLPTLQDYGYVGGRESLRTFCARVFVPGGPRFLRSDTGALAVFRHADVRAVAAMPNVSALAPAVLFPDMFEAGVLDDPAAPDRVGFAIADLIKNQLFTSNPPLNPVLRRVLLNQIGPKPMAGYAEQTRAMAAEILRGLPIGAPVDLVQQVAEPLTGRFWGALLGMSDDEAIAAAVEARRMTPMLHIRPSEESRSIADAAAKAYRALVEGAGRRAQARGGCPFVDRMAQDLAAVDFEDDLDHAGFVPKTVGAFLAGNLFDGFHTAALAATNTLYALLRHPEALDAVRRDPAKAPAAVAESLRLESPVIHLGRFTTDDVPYDEVVIPKGSHILIMWGAANHDPEAFPDPEAFDLARSQQGATTFGGGAHICPGRFAAALIARALLEALVETGLEVRLVPGADRWIGNHAMAQLEQLPVVFDRR